MSIRRLPSPKVKFRAPSIPNLQT
uniref:Uncharacterized protein n=1 Tax=Arundo donax TaxID=35708 RepID=A0A0A9CA23_ARUDO